jgi:hypothetical protein
MINLNAQVSDALYQQLVALAEKEKMSLNAMQSHGTDRPWGDIRYRSA